MDRSANFVLANLMPGLLSEFITGTPMAPLSGSILLYGGYLMMHMNNFNISGLDISRIIEILSTITVWINCPTTVPKINDVKSLLDIIKNTKLIPSSESPGKKIPVKALLYSMIDDDYSPKIKHIGLQNTIIKRLFKRICGQNTNDPVDLKKEILLFIEKISNYEKSEEELLNPSGEPPINVLDNAEIISNFILNNDNNNNNDENIIKFMKSSIKRDVLDGTRVGYGLMRVNDRGNAITLNMGH